MLVPKISMNLHRSRPDSIRLSQESNYLLYTYRYSGTWTQDPIKGWEILAFLLIPKHQTVDCIY